MPYAIMDLSDEGKVKLVSKDMFPFPPIEEEWLDLENEQLPFPPGWPENYYPVPLFGEEAEKISAALDAGKIVRIDRAGYAHIGEDMEQELFKLRECALGTAFLGAVLDHTLYASGEISHKWYQEARQFREKQLNEILGE